VLKAEIHAPDPTAERVRKAAAPAARNIPDDGRSAPRSPRVRQVSRGAAVERPPSRGTTAVLAVTVCVVPGAVAQR